MIGDLIGFTLRNFLSVYMALIMITSQTHYAIQSAVDNYVYSTADVASSQGVMTENMYAGLVDKLNQYSQGGSGYLIQLRLEKQLQAGVFDSYYESSIDRDAGNLRKNSIVGVPLDVGDRLTIFVRDNSPTLFGRLQTIPVFSSNSSQELLIRSAETAIIAKRMSEAVKGYDVIADVNTNDYAYDNVIRVVTKANPTGTEYDADSGSHPYRTINAADSDYIFPTGEFLKSEDKVGTKRVVTYVQQ